MEFSGIFYNYIVNKGKVRVKKFAEIYNYIVNKEKIVNLQLYLKYNNMQMASLSPRPIAKCDDGFGLSIQASSAHHCEKGENGIYKSVELGCLSSPEESLSEYKDWDDSSTYGYVPVEVVDAIIAKHGGIILPD